MARVLKRLVLLGFLGALAAPPGVRADDADDSVTARWNRGVDGYRAYEDFLQRGDVTNALAVATNALAVLEPLMYQRLNSEPTELAARAAEVVARLQYDRGEREAAAKAAQIALHFAPKDARANRNFTRATDGLLDLREKNHVNDVLKAAEGQDPTAILLNATRESRALFTDSGTYRTNGAVRTIALSDRLSARTRKLADAWLPVREAIANAVTNEEEAATIIARVQANMDATLKASEELSDLNPEAYATLSGVESAFTEFLKRTILPPAAIGEDLQAQSNAWLDVEAFNERPWQREALDYTRAFRARFPAWARAYEQQAQSDTNKPPFTAEQQAKVSALATELEKLQLECCENEVPAEQEKALRLIAEIQELLPKDKNGGQGGQPPPQGQPQGQPQQNPQQNPQQDQPDQGDDRQQEDPSRQPQPEEQQENAEASESKDDKEIEALLQKAKERNDEHEEDKRMRMRKTALPPNERDW